MTFSTYLTIFLRYAEDVVYSIVSGLVSCHHDGRRDVRPGERRRVVNDCRFISSIGSAGEKNNVRFHLFNLPYLHSREVVVEVAYNLGTGA